MAVQFDCDRSSLLNYEFPLPRYYQSHTTGSTNSSWSHPWTTLHYWTPDDIAAEFMQYWHSVTANDKTQRIIWRAFIDGTIGTMNGQQQQPATQETHIRQILTGAYPRPIVLQYRAITINFPRPTFTLPFSCGKTLFLENRIIYFKTRLRIKSPASERQSHRGTLVPQKSTM
jgi:hypothetical protein